MDQISFVVMAVMAGCLLLTAGALARGIERNLARGQTVRADMEQRLGRLLLGRLLQRAGIDVRYFLHSRYLHEIEREMRLCQACERTDRCRRCLHAHQPLSDFDFCPNYAMLIRSARITG
ncbi:MAG: DUF6455 family protein [Gammaproteobacteria bacterium]